MKLSSLVRRGTSSYSSAGSLLNRICARFAAESPAAVVAAKETTTPPPPSSAPVAPGQFAASSITNNSTSSLPPPTPTISLMDLVKQINNNHEVLLERVKTLETLVQGSTGLAAGDQKAAAALTEPEIEAERLRLTSENIELRKQVDSLVRQLTALEVAVKGADQVAPLSLLPKRPICNKPAQPSGAAAVAASDTAPTETPVPSAAAAAAKKQPTPAKEPRNKENQAPKQQEKKQKQPKQEGKPAKAAAPAKPAPEPERAIDGSRLDLRVGRIVDVQKHPDADSLYVEQIDCGEEGGPRTVVSGLVKHVPIEQMQNRLVIVLCNLKPAKMRGVLSEAMVMCASSPEKVEILLPPEGAVPGDRVTFEKYPGDPDSQLNPKKKIWEQIAPDLATNDDLLATYKGDPFVVAGKGPVKAETLKKVAVK